MYYLSDPQCHTCNIILPFVQRAFPQYWVHSQWYDGHCSLRTCNHCHDHLVAFSAYHDKLGHIYGWTKYVAHPQYGSGRHSPDLW